MLSSGYFGISTGGIRSPTPSHLPVPIRRCRKADSIPDVSPRTGAPEECSGQTVRTGDARIAKIREIGHARRPDQVPNHAATNPGPRLTGSFSPGTRIQRGVRLRAHLMVSVTRHWGIHFATAHRTTVTTWVAEKHNAISRSAVLEV